MVPFDISRLCNAIVACAFFSRMTLPKVSPTSGGGEPGDGGHRGEVMFPINRCHQRVVTCPGPAQTLGTYRFQSIGVTNEWCQGPERLEPLPAPPAAPCFQSIGVTNEWWRLESTLNKETARLIIFQSIGVSNEWWRQGPERPCSAGDLEAKSAHPLFS